MPIDSSVLLSAYSDQVEAEIAALLTEHGFRADGTMLSSPEGITVSSAAGATRVTFHEPTSSHGMGIVDFSAGTSPSVIAAVASALNDVALADRERRAQERYDRHHVEHLATVGTDVGQDNGSQPIAVVRLSQDVVAVDANPVNPPGGIGELLGDDLTELRVTVCRDGVWILAESRSGDPEYLRAWTPRHLRVDHDED